MTRGEALKDFFRKTILPVAAAALLYCIFRSACVKTGELDYLWLPPRLRNSQRTGRGTGVLLRQRGRGTGLQQSAGP